jgi:hypothetical protein
MTRSSAYGGVRHGEGRLRTHSSRRPAEEWRLLNVEPNKRERTANGAGIHEREPVLESLPLDEAGQWIPGGDFMTADEASPLGHDDEAGAKLRTSARDTYPRMGSNPLNRRTITASRLARSRSTRPNATVNATGISSHAPWYHLDTGCSEKPLIDASDYALQPRPKNGNINR